MVDDVTINIFFDCAVTSVIAFQLSPFNGTAIVVLLIVLQISFANVIIEQRS